MEPLSALYRPSTLDRLRESTEVNVLTEWEVDDSLRVEYLVAQGFDPKKGIFTCKRDGLYSIIVQIIPTDGGANVSNALRRRTDVAYCVHVQEPKSEKDDKEDEESSKFYDVGPTSFGELLHLKAGAQLSISSLPGSLRRESVRLSIDLVQRKRKRSPEPELTKKQLRKLRKKRRRNEDETPDDSESEWSFSSDESD